MKLVFEVEIEAQDKGWEKSMLNDIQHTFLAAASILEWVPGINTASSSRIEDKVPLAEVGITPQER